MYGRPGQRQPLSFESGRPARYVYRGVRPGGVGQLQSIAADRQRLVFGPVRLRDGDFSKLHAVLNQQVG